MSPKKNHTVEECLFEIQENSNDEKAIGRLFKDCRRQAKITLREFCKLNGLDHITMSRFERGDFKLKDRT